MVNKKAVRRKNKKILLFALSVLGLAVAANLVAVGYGVSFGAGLLFVIIVGLLTLCVIGGAHQKEVAGDEK